MLSVFLMLVAHVFAEPSELVGKSFDGELDGKWTFTFTDAKSGTLTIEKDIKKFTYLIDSTTKEIVMRVVVDGDELPLYATYSQLCLKCRFGEHEFLLLRKW